MSLCAIYAPVADEAEVQSARLVKDGRKDSVDRLKKLCEPTTRSNVPFLYVVRVIFEKIILRINLPIHLVHHDRVR